MQDWKKPRQEETLSMKDNTATKTVETEKEITGAQPLPYARWFRRVFKVLVPLLILGAGIAGASYISTTGPTARKKQPVKTAPLVQIETLHRSSERVVVPAMGTVIPAREIALKARVSGEIVNIHPKFMEGGLLKQGAQVLQIDPEDYKLAIEEKQSQATNATYELKLELGRQDVAQREWELLNGETSAKARDGELALRKPHLEKAEADLAAAEAELKQAKLNLARTIIRAPFNSIVRTKDVDLGSQASAQDQLAELVGTDEYWIQVSIPLDRLKWIAIPQENGDRGSRVRIIYGSDSGIPYECTGIVIKLLSDLETEGRMARVLVSVKDPLGLKTPKVKRPPLLIGQYVRLEIQGRDLDDVFRIPRAALRDNTKVWICGDDGRLDIRGVDIVWRDTHAVLVTDGLKEGERLIVSDLTAPVDGMDVRIPHPSSKAPEEVAEQPRPEKLSER
jgi:RND family efflux transporter MFP subunit